MIVKMTTDGVVNAAESKPRHPDRTRDIFGIQLEVFNNY